MSVAWYQDLKTLILTTLPISKDTAHAYVGVACLLLSMAVLRLRRPDARCLLFGALMSVAMEVLDLAMWWDRPRGPNFAASIHDLLNTNFLPVVLVVALRWLDRFGRDR